MAGIFSKDLWCLLFREYFDYDTVVTLQHVAKRLRDFMTPLQRELLNEISNNKQMYIKEVYRVFHLIKVTHDETLSSKRGVFCTCCGKRVALKKLSKHQRYCAWINNIQKPCDKCNFCGWLLPNIDKYHDRGCPYKSDKCIHCNLSISPLIYHKCPLTYKTCLYCKISVPSVLVAPRKHACKKLCLLCNYRATKFSQYCYHHHQENIGKCQVKIFVCIE